MIYLFWILFSLSFIVNLLLIWYIKKLFQNIRVLGKELKKTKKIVYEYVSHINRLNKMDTYSNEPTLVSLLDHGKQTIKKLNNMQNLFDSIQEVKIQKEQQDELFEEENSNYQEYEVLGAVRGKR